MKVYVWAGCYYYLLLLLLLLIKAHNMTSPVGLVSMLYGCWFSGLQIATNARWTMEDVSTSARTLLAATAVTVTAATRCMITGTTARKVNCTRSSTHVGLLYTVAQNKPDCLLLLSKCCIPTTKHVSMIMYSGVTREGEGADRPGWHPPWGDTRRKKHFCGQIYKE